jgi:hypothetical protein
MRWKPLAVIVVLLLLVASLTLIITQKPPTAPTTTPTSPDKWLNYGQVSGVFRANPGGHMEPSSFPLTVLVVTILLIAPATASLLEPAPATN